MTGPPAAAAWRRLTGSASAAAIAFCLLACGCALIAVAGPRAATQLRTNAYRELAARTPAADKTVIGTASAATVATGMQVASAGLPQLHTVRSALRVNLSAALPLAPVRADWDGMTAPFAGFADSGGETGSDETQLELIYRDPLDRYARLAAGELPAGTAAAADAGRVQAAVTAATARRFGLRVGSQVQLPGTGIILRITGIVSPREPGSPFWTTDPIAAAPVLVTPAEGEPYWQGGAFVSVAALAVLQKDFTTTSIQLTWLLPAALDHLTAARAMAITLRLPGALTTAGQLPGRGFANGFDLSLTSGAVSLLGEFTAQDGAVGNVLNLMSVSLAVVGAAVLLMAAWLMAERRREEFAVLRARGASRRQLAAAALRGSAAAAGPGTVVGIAAGVAVTPGAGTPLAWWLAGLTAVAALTGPVLITISVHRGYAGTTRPDRPPARTSAIRRLIAEAGLAGAAVGGLLVLRDQGTGPGSGDLYASAAPILIAIPVAIVMLRVYPLLVRLLLRLASRRTGVTAFLGLARAARVSAAAVLPAFAMVLALSLVAFAVMVRGAVQRGEAAESWQQAGADAVISVQAGLSPARQQAIAAVPGVQRTATLATAGAIAGSGQSLTVVYASPARYAALLATVPLAPAPARFAHWSAGQGSPVPVLASPGAGLGRPATTLQLPGGRLRIEVVGTVPAMSATSVAGGGTAGGYVVLPDSVSAAAGTSPDVLLVTGSHLDSRALTATVAKWRVAGASVVLRSALLQQLEQAPLQHGAYDELAAGGAAAAIGCLLVLLLTLLLSAQSRQLTLARVATMGLSAAQSRWLALIEALPQILSVLTGGLVCALALAPLVGPALSLSVFTGSATGVPVRIEPAWLLLTAAVLLVLALVTLTAQTMLASRQLPRSLRIGG